MGTAARTTVELIKNALAPYAGAVTTRRGSFGIDGDHEAVMRTLTWLSDVIEPASVDLSDATVVELGPGRTPEVLVGLLLLGAERGIGADITLQVPEDARDPARYEPLACRLSAADGLLLRYGTGRERVQERFAALAATGFDVEFLAYDGVALPVSDGSVDLVVSKSVMEHVRLETIDALLTAQRRVLRPGGCAVHIIDLRDHQHIQGDDEVVGDWLEALKIPALRYHWMYSRRSTYINRLRPSEWRDRFTRAGFEIAAWNERPYPLPAGFERAALQQPWSTLPEDQLAIGYVALTARRPV